MAIRPLPDQETLLKLLRYDPESGELFWRERPISMFCDGPKNSALSTMRMWNARFAGTEAFTSLNSSGYRNGAINHINFKAHRVIWKMVMGEEPEMIDHINGVRTDNRFCNLRVVSPRENCQNAATYRSNSSGAVGVDYIKAIPGERRACWRARINVKGKLLTLGSFATKDDAIRARKAAERKYGFHPNHGRRIQR